MIELADVFKRYRTTHGYHQVLSGVNFIINPSERIGILGRNGAGKSTLIRLIGGAELPTKGSITRKMSVSWPLAFGGAFQGSLTGIDNTRFICRVYGADPDQAIDYVKEFSELGKFMKEPVKTYSSGMQSRLAFAISMAIEFDCYLIDEVISVGDARFHEKCRIELFEKRADRAMILVSHDSKHVANFCKKASVLDKGILSNFQTIEEAYENYNQLK